MRYILLAAALSLSLFQNHAGAQGLRCAGLAKPVRPLAHCPNATPSCLCDTYGQNCRWIWNCFSDPPTGVDPHIPRGGTSTPRRSGIDPMIPLMVQPVPQIGLSPLVQQLILLRAMEQMQERQAQRQIEWERQLQQEREAQRRIEWERQLHQERQAQRQIDQERAREAKPGSPIPRERLDSWLGKVAAARSRYPDYDEVVARSGGLAITPVMTGFMIESDYGADIAYWLFEAP